jgi:hypothetical protein
MSRAVVKIEVSAEETDGLGLATTSAHRDLSYLRLARPCSAGNRVHLVRFKRFTSSWSSADKSGDRLVNNQMATADRNSEYPSYLLLPRLLHSRSDFFPPEDRCWSIQ